MMNRMALVGIFAFAIGCTGDEGDKPSGETGTVDTDTMTECPTMFTGPTVITDASVTCASPTEVRFEVNTEGWTTGGLFFSQETANVEPQYSDEHDLESFDYDPCQAWDSLERTLTTNVAFGADTTNQSTVFSCGADEHFAAASGTVMTYVARVYDFDGNFADCFGWGNDFADATNGTSSRVNDPGGDYTTEMGNCYDATAAR